MISTTAVNTSIGKSSEKGTILSDHSDLIDWQEPSKKAKTAILALFHTAA